MKSQTLIFVGACALSVLTALGGDNPRAASASNFNSHSARSASNEGSPVGPPQKIMICHKGHTIYVAEPAVPAHLAHGDTLGPCPGEAVICAGHHPGDQHPVTMIVNMNDLPGYQAQGATLGPCPNSVFMCNRKGRTVAVPARNVSDRLAKGFTSGLCPNQSLVCYKGKSLRINNDQLSDYLAKGACVGYCYGGPGPIVPGNGCSTNNLSNSAVSP